MKRRSILWGFNSTKYLSLILAVSVSLGNILFAQSHWTPLGVYGISGSSDIEFDQLSRTLIIAGNGTVARSSDHGLAWELKPHRFYTYNPSLWVVSPDSFLITASEYGVIATTNGGEMFSPRVNGITMYSSVFNTQYITGNPINKNDLWLFNDDGYRSTDMGATWNKCLWGKAQGKTYRSAAFSSVNPQYMCLLNSLNEQIFISKNGGNTWQKRYENKDRSSDIYKILITPRGNIYAGSLLSLDSGKTWQQTKVGARIDKYCYSIDFIYNPKDSMVYMADYHYGIFNTYDGGSVFYPTPLSNTESWQEYRHSLELAVDTTSGLIFANVNDSLYSLKDTVSINIAHGLSLSPIHSLVAIDGEGDTLLSGTESEFIKSTDKGKTWRVIYNNWGSALYKFIEASPHLPGFIVSGSLSTQYMLISLDGGETQWPVFMGGLMDAGIKFDPFEPEYLYAAGTGLWRVRDTSLINSTLFDHIPGEMLNNKYNILSFLFDPKRQGTIYSIALAGGGMENAIIRFTEYGKNADTLLTNSSPDDWFMDIVVDPSNPAKLYIGSSKGCYTSTDTGCSWNLYDEGFESRNVYKLLIDPENPDVLYAGTFNDCGFGPGEDVNCRGGVYRSLNAGRSWERLPDQGLHNWNITEMTIVRNPKRLLVGTECGAYEYILPPVTSVESPEKPASSSLVLHQNYPNPFTSSTTITYSLPDGCKDKESLSLKIYDALGREVLDLSSHARTGNTSVTVTNAQLPRSGVYFCRLTAKDGAGRMHVAARRISFVK